MLITRGRRFNGIENRCLVRRADMLVSRGRRFNGIKSRGRVRTADMLVSRNLRYIRIEIVRRLACVTALQLIHVQCPN